MRFLILLAAALLLSGCAGLLPKGQLLETQKNADLTYAQGRYAEAATGYRRLADALPSDAGVRYQLANSLARQGDVQGAIAQYRETLLRDPQHARAWHNLLQVQLGEALQTAAELQRTLNPQQPHAERSLRRAEQVLRLLEAPQPTPEPAPPAEPESEAQPAREEP